MAEDEKHEYGLVVSYRGLDFGANPEHAFVRGVEIGMLWQRMQGTETEIEGTYHAANREAIERHATAHGWHVDFAETDYPDWVFAKLAFTNSALRSKRTNREIEIFEVFDDCEVDGSPGSNPVVRAKRSECLHDAGTG